MSSSGVALPQHALGQLGQLLRLADAHLEVGVAAAGVGLGLPPDADQQALQVEHAVEANADMVGADPLHQVADLLEQQPGGGVVPGHEDTDAR